MRTPASERGAGLWVGLASVARMIIDCGRCAVRGGACADCVVTFLTVEVREPVPPPPAAEAPLDLDGAERAAIDVLASCGLVPPLRLVPGEVPRLGRAG